MPMTRIPAVLTFLVLLLAGPMSCAPVKVSMPALVLDGPALHIAGVYSGMRLQGTMDRGCMAGVGELHLRAAGVADGVTDLAGTGDTDGAPTQAFACSAKLDVLPDRKARVNGTLECTSGRRMAFSLRNLGPDQGVGIAREFQEGGLMIFFYHAAESEAERRLPQILADMEKLRAAAEK
jgi:hypothetical protein